MFTISKEANPNYLAQIVQLKNPKKHPNADKLICWNINFQNVITNLNYKEDDICVYFPLECKINHNFLSWSNSYSDSELNQNKEQKGFFDKKSRVRAVRLRGEPSQGYIIPLKVLYEWQSIDILNEKEIKIGEQFDTFNNIKICEKYVVIKHENNPLSKNDKRNKNVKRISRLVEGQLKLHNDTSQLRLNLHQINPETVISINYKKHGTSFVVGNILTKRKLNWLEKLLKKCKLNISDKVYDFVYASRNVVKNEYETRNAQHFYQTDIWGEVKEEIKNKIPKGYTLYGEIIGYTKQGGYIQKGFDYGCKQGEYKVYIYKISITNEDGFVIYLDDKQIEEFCEKYELNFKDTFIFYGKAYELTPKLNQETDEEWRIKLLEKLTEKYTNKNCYMCVNKVPEEGIVLRKQKLFEYEAYKLKSSNFMEYESKQLDEEIISLEDQN